MADQVDELISLRNLFYLGCYQQVINEATNPHQPRSEAAKLERKVFLYRAYLSQQKYQIVIAETQNSQSPELLAVNFLAKFFVCLNQSGGGSPHEIEKCINDMKEILNLYQTSDIVAVIGATLFYVHGAYDEALSYVHQRTKNLESVALTVQIFLKLNRPNLAQQQVKQLKSWADDDTLAQLIEAWVNLYTGGPDKYQEAAYAFEELGSSKGSSAHVLSSQAVCKMQAGNFVEAETILLEAMNKNNSDPTTIINLIACATATGKPADLISRYFSQLGDLNANNSYILEIQAKESLFDRCAQRYSL